MTTRIGFIGCGIMAQAHLQNVHESQSAEVVAVCDVIPRISEEAAVKYGGVAFTSYVQMLDSEKLDAVYVCVPPFAHENIEEYAARKGIHLFVEKPLGLDLQTVERKSHAISESGIIASVGYCLRYLDIVAEAKRYLSQRTVAMINGHYLTKFLESPAWWRMMSKSGGQLVEQTTHTVDLLRYLAGDVRAVHANMALRVSQSIENLDTYDVGSVNLEFKSGAIGHVSTSFTQPDHRSGIEILGQQFRIHIDGAKLTIVEPGQTVIKTSTVDFYKEEDRVFLNAIETGDRTQILSTYDDAVKTLAVTLGATQSARLCKIIQL